MNNEDLQLIINSLETIVKRENAIFGIYKYGTGTDESYIKANNEGLELFALELLKKAKYDEEAGQSKLPIDYLQNWFDIKADTFIQYVEIVNKSTETFRSLPYKLTIKEKLIPLAFIIAGLIGLFFMIVGIYTAVKFIF